MPDLHPAASPDRPPVPVRAHHAGLRVEDIDAAISWYSDVLNFKVLQTFEVGGARFAYLASSAQDDFRIELFGGQKAGPNPDRFAADRPGWDHLCLEVDDTDATLAALRRLGVAILREPVDIAAIGRRIAFFADPWGNRFELFGPIGATRTER